MELHAREEDLFASWRGTVPTFVSDGAVDAEAYGGSKPRTLLLLKEVNDRTGGGWCLREFLCEGGRPETWDVVTRWVRAIRRLPAEVPWAELQAITSDQRKDALRSIVAMNLKKAPGGHTTEMRTWWAAVRRDAEFVARQFALYDAELVICCGFDVVRAFTTFIQPQVAGAWRRTSRGVEYLEYAANRFVVGYSHPEARIAPNLLHYGLVDAIREIQGGGTPMAARLASA